MKGTNRLFDTTTVAVDVPDTFSCMYVQSAEQQGSVVHVRTGFFFFGSLHREGLKKLLFMFRAI